jgi:hypothetical protein
VILHLTCRADDGKKRVLRLFASVQLLPHFTGLNRDRLAIQL